MINAFFRALNDKFLSHKMNNSSLPKSIVYEESPLEVRKLLADMDELKKNNTRKYFECLTIHDHKPVPLMVLVKDEDANMYKLVMFAEYDKRDVVEIPKNVFDGTPKELQSLYDIYVDHASVNEQEIVRLNTKWEIGRCNGVAFHDYMGYTGLKMCGNNTFNNNKYCFECSTIFFSNTYNSLHLTTMKDIIGEARTKLRTVNPYKDTQETLRVKQGIEFIPSRYKLISDEECIIRRHAHVAFFKAIKGAERGVAQLNLRWIYEGCWAKGERPPLELLLKIKEINERPKTRKGNIRKHPLFDKPKKLLV